MIALVHDLAEAQGTFMTSLVAPIPDSLDAVGDISPREGIPKTEKRRLEAVCSVFTASLRVSCCDHWLHP